MNILAAAAAGFLMDLLLGDPHWMPHPVVIMGKCISQSEKVLRKIFPKTPAGERWAGRVLAAGLPLVTLLVSAGAIHFLRLLHPTAGFFLAAVWSWQALAIRDLAKESKNVYRKLTGATLADARSAVARIVGRDTAALTEEGVTKAAVETVAENFSDGVIAPMFYLMIGGAPLALCYKAINTMDSMIGYKNERYLNFGRAAARLDDAANYLPARLSALILIVSAALCGQDARRAAGIWKRDRCNHASPNSAQTESVMAGALGVQLAGPAWYFGEYYEKPTIGDALRRVEPGDILRANRMLYVGSFLGLLLMGVIRLGICIVI